MRRILHILPLSAALVALTALAAFAAPEAATSENQADQPIVQARLNPAETPEYCRAKYEQCLRDCDKDPLNKTKYDKDACHSSCYSTFSGCGR